MTIAELVCRATREREATVTIVAMGLSTLIFPMSKVAGIAPEATQCVGYAVSIAFVLLVLFILGNDRPTPAPACESIGRYRTDKKAAAFLFSVFGIETLLATSGAVLFSFSSGVFDAIALNSGFNKEGSEVLFVVATIVICLVYQIGVSASRRIWMGGVFTLTCGLFFLAYMALVATAGVDSTLYAVVRIGLQVYYITLWVFISNEAVNQNVPAAFMFGLFAAGPVALSRMAGKVVPFVMEAMGGAAPDRGQLAVVLLAVALATLMVLVAILARLSSVGREKPAEPPVEAPDAYAAFAAAHGLTGQELSALRRYAVGRSAQHVAEELDLSPYTVKEYVRRIYTKLDVHSKQELIDLVETESRHGSGDSDNE